MFKPYKELEGEIKDYAYLLTKDYLIKYSNQDRVRIENHISTEIEKKFGIVAENFYRNSWMASMNEALLIYSKKTDKQIIVELQDKLHRRNKLCNARAREIEELKERIEQKGFESYPFNTISCECGATFHTNKDCEPICQSCKEELEDEGKWEERY